MATNIPEGYALIEGRSRKNAQAALDAAAQAGVDPVEVRAVVEGYIVPSAVADAYHDPSAAAPADPDQEAGDEPDESWKNADIAAWAEDHEVDLAGATKKADMLAAIAASNKEE